MGPNLSSLSLVDAEDIPALSVSLSKVKREKTFKKDHENSSIMSETHECQEKKHNGHFQD